MAALAAQPEASMTLHLPYASSARALVAALTLAGLAACGDRVSNTHASVPQADKPSPSTLVIGQAPAEPSGDPPGTTPVASGTTEISKTVETTAKPQEGDNHSHSTEAATTPQKADGNNQAAQRSTQ
jgi:hypothetical protein